MFPLARHTPHTLGSLKFGFWPSVGLLVHSVDAKQPYSHGVIRGSIPENCRNDQGVPSEEWLEHLGLLSIVIMGELEGRFTKLCMAMQKAEREREKIFSFVPNARTWG